MNANLWRMTLASLNKAFKLNSLAIELDGTLMFQPDFCNSFCPAVVNASKDHRKGCDLSYLNAINEARKTNDVFVSVCDSGFLRLLIPVNLHGKLIGCVGGCGALDQSGSIDVEKIKRLALNVDLPLERLLAEANASVVKLSPNTIETYFTLLKNRLERRSLR